jgi:hypothetical protein
VPAREHRKCSSTSTSGPRRPDDFVHPMLVHTSPSLAGVVRAAPVAAGNSGRRPFEDPVCEVGFVGVVAFGRNGSPGLAGWVTE